MANHFASNEEAVAHMRDVAVQRSGFTRWLGVEPRRCFDGVAELDLVLRDELTQHHGYAHGAIVGLMADNACAWAAASAAGDVVTGNYTINFVAPAQGERLLARGEVVKAGRRQVIVRAEVWAEREGARTLVAVAQATVIPVARPAQERPDG